MFPDIQFFTKAQGKQNVSVNRILPLGFQLATFSVIVENMGLLLNRSKAIFYPGYLLVLWLWVSYLILSFISFLAKKHY